MRFGYLPLKKENNRAGEAESKVISKGGWDWKLGGVPQGGKEHLI